MGRYQPLIVIVLFALLGGIFLSFQSRDVSFFLTWMIGFAALFFFFLSAFKFFDLNGFAEGFSKYDLLASKYRGYAKIYPFFELVIALSFFSGILIKPVAIFTIVLMAFSALGVIKAVLSKQDLKCACMGTKLDLPLTVVSIIENGAMGIMSLMIALML